MQYEFHPLAMDYRRMSAHDLGRMEEGMRGSGFDERFPIVLFNGKILDGCNRYLACQAATVEPVFTTFDGTEEEARFFVQIANEERRHLTEEELSHKRQARIERVAEARRNGDSLRTIAETEKVSVVQVQRDLEEASTVPGGGTVEPQTGKVTGKDGKERPATMPTKPKETESIFCRKCRTNGPAKNCKDCKALRKPREPGDDSESEETSHKADRKAKQANGKPVFEWRDYENAFGPVARAPNRIIEAYPAEKKSDEYAESMKLLGMFAEVMKTWKKRLAKGA